MCHECLYFTFFSRNWLPCIASCIHSIFDFIRYVQMDALENTDDSDDDDNSDISLDALTPVVTTMVSTLIQQSRLQTQFLVPVITLLIPACEQTSLNSIILRSMGVWDSRLYLVGMSEAVEELSSSPTLEEGDITERDLFRQEIPMLIRSLIPRWKRLLYDPRIMIPTPSSSCHAMADRSNE